MKLLRVECNGAPAWGVLEEERVRLLKHDPFETVELTDIVLPLAECRLLAPCVPTKIICIGKNYYDHAAEMGEGIPERPLLFMKGPNAVNCHEGSVHAPAFVHRLDYEGELAFVIKKRAKDVKESDFTDYVLGYTCLNDVTARDIQKGDGQWTRGKGMDGFAPFGPWITDEVDGADLKIETRLNGKTVQSSRTSLLMHALPELLAFITASMTLEPGDVVATGTPAGIGPMAVGDTVEVEIEGIGVLRNHIV